MKPFSNTEEFLQWVIDDYRDETVKQDAKIMNQKSLDGNKALRQKFLYKFLKSSKDKKAAGWHNNPNNFSTNDKYIYIKSMYLAFKDGKKTEEEYRAAFKRINESIKGNVKKRENLLGTDLKKAQDALEERLLRNCADDFISNAKKSKFLSSKTTAKTAAAKRGENIDLIEMLHEFYKYAGKEDCKEDCNEDREEGYEVGSIVSKVDIKRYAKLFKMVKDSKYSAFIPLYIHQKSGAGVYIIKGFPGLVEKANVCVLSFDRILDDKLDEILEDELEENEQHPFPILMNIVNMRGSKISSKINSKNDSESKREKEEEEECKNIVEYMFDVLQSYIEEESYLPQYWDYNLIESLDNIDKRFSPFFSLTDEARNNIKRDYAEREDAEIKKMKAKGKDFS